jgi:hypothetical protein
MERQCNAASQGLNEARKRHAADEAAQTERQTKLAEKTPCRLNSRRGA